MTHFVTPGLYPIWVTSRQLGSATYPLMGYSLRSKADNSDPHPQSSPQSRPPIRPRGCLRSDFPAGEEGNLLLSSARNSQRRSPGNSALGSPRSPRGCSGHGRPRCSHHRFPSSSDSGSHSRLEGRFQSNFPTSLQRPVRGISDCRLAQRPTGPAVANVD